MSDRYSKDDVSRIAKGLIEDVRELDDGSGISTWQLLKDANYDMDSFRPMDLFEIHDALFREAKKNRMTLDLSAHKDHPEGLTYNLDFIIRNKRAQIKCPRCGSKNTARYIYGYPAYSERLQNKLDAGKWALGGCCVTGVEINGRPVETMPKRRCHDCKKDFAAPPILIRPNTETAEDLRDIAVSVAFSIGGYLHGFTRIDITKNEHGALAQVSMLRNADPDPNGFPEDKQISKKAWKEILDRLYGPIYLHEWKKSYIDPAVMDGEQWSLEIGLTGKRKRSYSGSNAYPPYWNELLRIFRKFAKV